MPRGLLRVVTCGSVDDGKSTLIGRLLHDAGAVSEDQLAALRRDSQRHGAPGDGIDFALLADGLAAEREQGITIDVAHRYVSTARRSFILADAPGHAQYTRNLVNAASVAQAAVLLVDVAAGVSAQTRRHVHLLALLDVRHVVLAVSKMDLVDFREDAFTGVVREVRAVAERAHLSIAAAIPLSGLTGHNVVTAAASTPWYRGPTLLEWLETVDPDRDAAAAGPLRLPVQLVSRTDGGFRGYAGSIAAGTVKPGDAVVVLPAGTPATVARIVTFDGDLPAADAGAAVTLCFAEPVACGRGDVIATADAPPGVADQFDAVLIWLDATPLLPGRRYRLKLATREVDATVRAPRYRIDIDTAERLAAPTLATNDIGVATLATDEPVVFEPFSDSRALGGFILIDRDTGATAAAGIVRSGLYRAATVRAQPLAVARSDRAALKHQRARVVWFTGLSGAGKSTIANLVDARLTALGRHTALLDGDNVRRGLNRDLGFTDADRVENIRRIAEVARLMSDAGLIVLVAFISPFAAERAAARATAAPGEFVEVHVDATLAEAERRDPKGLYARARAGEIAHFTGIGSAYEPPVSPELRIDTAAISADEAAALIVAHLLDDR